MEIADQCEGSHAGPFGVTDSAGAGEAGMGPKGTALHEKPQL